MENQAKTWINIYRTIIGGLLAIIAWYFIQSDTSNKQFIQTITTAVTLATTTNDLQDILLEILRETNRDFELRLRSLEGWRVNVNPLIQGGQN